MQPKISEFTKRCFKGLTYGNSHSGTFSPLTISRSMYRLNAIVQNDTLSKHQLSYFFGKNNYPFSNCRIKKYTENINTFLASPNEPVMLPRKPSRTSTTSVTLSSSKYPTICPTYDPLSAVKIITSSLDFEAKWIHPMYKTGVSSGFIPFYQKMTADVSMMSSVVPVKCNYYEDDKITLLEKSLSNNMVMGFISAHHDCDLDISNLDQYLQAMETKCVVVSIPEFNITNVYDTKFKKYPFSNEKEQVFTHHDKDYVDFEYFFNSLGITNIFWPNETNLNGIYDDSVSVKQIRHETRLNIGANGINTKNSDQTLDNNKHIKADKEFYTDHVFTWYVRNTIDNNIILCGIFDGLDY